MRVKIKVTDEHQARGQCHFAFGKRPADSGVTRCYTCPVALAILDVLKPGARVAVLSKYVNIGFGESPLTEWHKPIYLDMTTQAAVDEFDRNRYCTKVFNHLEFTLDIPVEYLREEYVG